MKKFSPYEINFMVNDLDFPEPLKRRFGDDSDITSRYYWFLYKLAWFGWPALMVELGTYKGYGAASMIFGNPSARVISMDIEDFVENHPDRVIGGIDYWHCNSCHPEYDLKDIGILFIDTLHDGKMCLDEFNFYKDRMHQNGIVLFDDIYLNPEMKKFWDEFKPNGIKMELPLHGEAGFGLVLLNQEAQEA